MVDEPEIIKQLRESEKLGFLQNKIQNSYEELESVEESSENISYETFAFSEDNNVEDNMMKEISDQKQSKKKFSSFFDNFNIDIGKNIFDRIDDGIYIVDQQYNIQYINLTIKREFGPVNNRKCYEFFHDRNKSCPWCKNADVLEGKTMHSMWHSSKNNKYYDLFDMPIVRSDGTKFKFKMFHDITEQMETENLLKKQKNLLETIFDNTPNMFYLKDTNLIYRTVNKTFCEFVGKKEEEIIGKTDLDLFPQKEAKQYHLEDKSVIKGGKQQRKELKVKDKGEIKWINVVKSPLRGEEGEVTGVICSLSDISKIKNTEERLIQSEKENEDFINSAADGMRIVGRDFNVKKINRAMSNLSGFNIKESIGMNCQKMFGAKDICGTKNCSMVKILKNGKKYQQECKRKRKDGSYISTLEMVSPYKDSNGEIIGIIEDFRDITKIKKIEEKIAESERRFRDISEVSGDWIWETDKDGRYTYISGKCEKITGYKATELIGKTPFELMDENEAKRVGTIFKAIFSKNKDIENLEKCIITKNGNKLYFLTNGKPILDKKGKLIGYRGIDRDITEQKKSEEIIKSQIKKSDLLNSMISKGGKNSSIEQFFQDVIDELLMKTNFDAGSIYLVDDQGKTASIISSKNINKTFFDSIKTIKINTSPYDEIFINKKSIFTDRYDKLQPEFSKISGFRSVASIPVPCKDKVIGALNFGKIKDDNINNSEKEILKSVAIEVGNIYERITYKNNLEEKIDELSKWKKVMIGREIKMRDLKEKIKELESKK